MILEEMFEIKEEKKSAKLHKQFKEFVIYGFGNAGKDVFKILKNKDFPISCIIDKNAQPNSNHKGIPVITPQTAKLRSKNDVCVVIGIFNAFVDLREVYTVLEDIGYKNIINFYELCHIFPEELSDRFFMQTKDYFKTNKEIILDTQQLFEDSKSKEVYGKSLIFRYTADILQSPKPDDVNIQYFPEDIPGWSVPSAFIDCGAFDGDTIKMLYAKAGRINSIAAFEPDSANFEKLQNVIQSLNPAAQVISFPCGVYSKATQLKFNSSADGASSISESGDVLIQTVSLDEALKGFNPDLIKMDIEGAEVDALIGAKEMITKNRPNLAISLYHKPQHMWQIPNMIKSWNLGYKFYIRVFCYQTFDVVLFAVK